MGRGSGASACSPPHLMSRREWRYTSRRALWRTPLPQKGVTSYDRSGGRLALTRASCK
jgi:hypothetical protein